MEIKESIDEIESNSAIIEVSSSIKLFSDFSAKWSEVIINKQNPSSVAEVFNIW
jgi:hypothetical protein